MHFLRREGRVFIRIFPHKPICGKPLETRMGKGKAEPEYWVAVVKPGTVMFEITGVRQADGQARPGPRRPQDAGPVPVRRRRHAVA